MFWMLSFLTINCWNNFCLKSNWLELKRTQPCNILIKLHQNCQSLSLQIKSKQDLFSSINLRCTWIFDENRDFDSIPTRSCVSDLPSVSLLSEILKLNKIIMFCSHDLKIIFALANMNLNYSMYWKTVL